MYGYSGGGQCGRTGGVVVQEGWGGRTGGVVRVELLTLGGAPHHGANNLWWPGEVVVV